MIWRHIRSKRSEFISLQQFFLILCRATKGNFVILHLWLRYTGMYRKGRGYLKGLFFTCIKVWNDEVLNGGQECTLIRRDEERMAGCCATLSNKSAIGNGVSSGSLYLHTTTALYSLLLPAHPLPGQPLNISQSLLHSWIKGYINFAVCDDFKYSPYGVLPWSNY